jgi:serine/threonine-protein kinase
MRLPGLAHGWEGQAWVALQRARSGLAPLDPRFASALRRWLRAVADRPPGGPAQLIGAGGAATVAALARDADPSLAAVADRVLARWAASTCDAADDDLFLGHPGALVALSELVSGLRWFQVPRAFATRCYRRTTAALRRTLASEQPHFLGLAHGLAGLLLAVEHGAARLGQRREVDLVERAFDRLAAARLVAPGIGVVWPSSTAGEVAGLSSALCHGSAGIALALHGCHRLTGEAAYRELRDVALDAVVRLPSQNQTFCCGRAGRAQVLLELHRHDGDPRWLDAARRVAAEPTPPMSRRASRRSFHQGRLGLAYLDERLRHPRALPLPGAASADQSATA